MTTKIEHCNLRSEMSKNFKIKVYSSMDGGKTKNSLVGYSGLIDLVGSELAVKLMINAIDSEEQEIVNKLRRGIKVTFYSI
jgi:hypothetical protein